MVHARCRITSFCCALLIYCCCQTFAAPATQPAANIGFLKQSAATGLEIVQLTMLATTKADAPETRKFANDVLERQANLNTQIKKMAQQRGTTLDTKPDPAQQQQLDAVSHQYGRLLDRAYLKQLIDLQSKLSASAATQQQGQFSPLTAQIISVANDDITQARVIADKIGITLNGDSTTSP